MDSEEPKIVQLQRAVHRLLPAIVLLTVSRLLLVGALNFAHLILNQTAAKTSKRLARVFRALERAGVAAASLSLVLAFVASGDQLIRETSQCYYPTSPRPHALIFTSAMFLLLSTSRFVCVLPALITLMLLDQQFPGAWFAVSLALIEWSNPTGLASELLAISAHMGTLTFATAYQKMCTPRHDKAVGILTAIAYIGCVSWSFILFRRHIAKRIVDSLRSRARALS